MFVYLLNNLSDNLNDISQSSLFTNRLGRWYSVQSVYSQFSRQFAASYFKEYFAHLNDPLVRIQRQVAKKVQKIKKRNLYQIYIY